MKAIPLTTSTCGVQSEPSEDKGQPVSRSEQNPTPVPVTNGCDYPHALAALKCLHLNELREIVEIVPN
jgi:hypothetical protein